MSMMQCDCCERHIDTDWDCEGEWDVKVKNSDKTKDFVCGACCEKYLTEDLIFDPDLPETTALRDKGDAMAALAEDNQ